jgi:hypothetical protein
VFGIEFWSVFFCRIIITTESQAVTTRTYWQSGLLSEVVSLDVVPSVEEFERNILDDNFWSDHL